MARLLIALAAALIIPALGQEAEAPQKPVLRFSGNPIVLPFECTNDDIAWFAMSCTAAVPCPIYLQLNSVQPVENKLFLSGSLHNGSATMYSVLLASEDGGLSWTEPHERLRGASLDRIFFYDAEHGWVSGHVMDFEPRDPFFLLTTDGGKIWRRRNIFDDTRVAVVDKFWFDSARSGVVLIDRLHPNEAGARYERFETMTGGESWMIREVSAQPIRVREPLVAAPDREWRLRADKQSGSWLLQHRQPDGWAVVASFGIEVTRCAPVEEEIAEAPPEPEAGREQELPVAPGGVFQVGSPPKPVTPPPAKERKPPTLKKARP